ncbi:MAG: helix-turn-helix domain-containing protein [Blastocatellia bacterium]
MEETSLTSAQAAVELGLSLRRVQALVSSGMLRAKRFGERWVIRAADLDGVRNMIRDKAGGGGRPTRPLKEFGPNALVEFSGGTLIRTGSATYWFALPARDAVKAVPARSRGQGEDWEALKAYASSTVQTNRD